MNILLVEDDVAYRTAITKELESQGWRVTAVGTADAALDAVAKTAFDAIVCDFILTASEGTTVYEAIRQTDPKLAERLLFVTGWGKDSNARKLLEHTGRPVLEKPVDLAALVKAVRALGATK